MSIPMRTFFSKSATRKVSAIAVAACAMSMATSVQAQTAQSNLRNTSLLKFMGYKPGELLVTFKTNPLGQEAQNVNTRIGARTKQTFSFINTQRVSLPSNLSIAEATKQYAADPNVASVQPNFLYQGLVTPNDSLYPQQYALPLIKAPQAWDFVTGSVASTNAVPPQFKNPRDLARWLKNNRTPKDVVVAVIDTGVAINHLDIRGNLWRNTKEIAGNGVDDDKNGYIDDLYGIDTANGDTNPDDDEGHGTHVAGIIGAFGNNSFGTTGVNWRTKIMALKFLNRSGVGNSGTAITCMEYMIRMKKRGVNVRVANHSWGPLLAPQTGVAFDAALLKAFRDAGKEGILNVIAAGNDAHDNDLFATYPANLQVENKLVVAASDQNDNPAPFTNFGARTVDLAAPGVDILSTYPFMDAPSVATPTPTGTPGATPSPTPVFEVPSNRSFKRLSGTSMAAPHVAGAAALLFAFTPELTATQVRNSIMAGVDGPSDNVPQWVGLVHSNGRLNIYKALTESFVYRHNYNPGTPPTPNPTPIPVASPPVPTPTPDPNATPTPTPDPNATPTPTPDPNATPTPPPAPTPLTNGNIVFTQQVFTNGGAFFQTINQMGKDGGASTILESGIRELQNPYISLKTGRIAFVVNLANITGENRSTLERYGYSRTVSYPENEIFIRDLNGNVTRITNDEANPDDINEGRPVDDREPAISPDGTRLVFTKRNAAGNDDLYITSALRDLTRPGGAPRQFKLVGDVGGSASQESHASWSPDGKRIVFQSNRVTVKAGQTRSDYDIYMVTVPAVFNADSVAPTPVQLTNTLGDDVEPSVGPVTPVSRFVRPNGQLVYASNRNDENSNEDDGPFSFTGLVRGPDVANKPTYTSANSQVYNFGEDYDIYLQDLSLENDGSTLPSNRAQRIVDTPREARLVLGGTGDVFTSLIDSGGNDNADDDYFIGIAVSGDDRRPVMSADGTQVIFCSDSIFRSPAGLSPIIKSNNPDDDYDIVRVDVDGRNFVRLTSDRPTRTYIAVGGGVDSGAIAVTEDYEPSAGAVPTITLTPAQTSQTGGAESLASSSKTLSIKELFSSRTTPVQ